MTTTWIATELRYMGKATIESIEQDGNLLVILADGRKGRVAPDQCHKTQKAARLFATAPMVGGWSDVAKLSTL